MRFRDVLRKPADSKLTRWRDRWSVWSCEHDQINLQFNEGQPHYWLGPPFSNVVCMWCGLCRECGERHHPHGPGQIQKCPNAVTPLPQATYASLLAMAGAPSGMTYQSLPYYADERPAPFELPVEKRDAPVIGYRGWFLRESSDTVLLRSANESFGYWAHDTHTHARCQGYSEIGHSAPLAECECGLYVLADLAHARYWLGGYGALPPQDVAVGAVVGWGKVIQHGSEGWRAEYARPIAFLDTQLLDEQPLLVRCSEQMGIPILGREALQIFAKEYGEKLPSLEAHQ